MILVDTSIWIDHLRSGDKRLGELLDAAAVLVHPFVIGEIALVQLGQRNIVLQALAALPMATSATDAEVMGFIDHHVLFGRGIGYVDAHLLAATRLTPDATLWTNDRRLRKLAGDLGLDGAC
ncbi:type II toxin-antitoxin system VapC family toxin [Rhodopila sp.]|uniref:type II toxin-antitoxin system VapC family toxin n=1 Tax=Rhodopila sp. TaxID=2480087 RepID=UPI003D151A96